MGLTYTISIVNWSFGFSFIFFFTDFKLLMFHKKKNQKKKKKIRNFEYVELVENLSPNYAPYQFMQILQPFLLWEKKWRYSIF